MEDNTSGFRFNVGDIVYVTNPYYLTKYTGMNMVVTERVGNGIERHGYYVTELGLGLRNSKKSIFFFESSLSPVEEIPKPPPAPPAPKQMELF